MLDLLLAVEYKLITNIMHDISQVYETLLAKEKKLLLTCMCYYFYAQNTLWCDLCHHTNTNLTYELYSKRTFKGMVYINEALIK